MQANSTSTAPKIGSSYATYPLKIGNDAAEQFRLDLNPGRFSVTLHMAERVSDPTFLSKNRIVVFSWCDSTGYHETCFYEAEEDSGSVWVGDNTVTAIQYTLDVDVDTDISVFARVIYNDLYFADSYLYIDPQMSYINLDV